MLDPFYDRLNALAESSGLGLRFDSVLDVLATFGILAAVGWFAMHLIFD